MSIKTCKQHTKEPVFIYAACAGCEIQRYRDDVKALKEDAERYRWMKANVRNGSFGTDTGWIDDDTEHWDDDLDLKMGVTTLK